MASYTMKPLLSWPLATGTKRCVATSLLKKLEGLEKDAATLVANGTKRCVATSLLKKLEGMEKDTATLVDRHLDDPRSLFADLLSMVRQRSIRLCGDAVEKVRVMPLKPWIAGVLSIRRSRCMSNHGCPEEKPRLWEKPANCRCRSWEKPFSGGRSGAGDQSQGLH